MKDKWQMGDFLGSFLKPSRIKYSRNASSFGVRFLKDVLGKLMVDFQRNNDVSQVIIFRAQTKTISAFNSGNEPKRSVVGGFLLG